MMRPPASTLIRYGAAIAVVLLATAVRLVLDPVLGERFPAITYMVALVFAGWFGGFGPSVAALLLSSLLLPLVVLEPRGSLSISNPQARAGYAIYVVLGMAVALMGGSMRGAKTRAEESAKAARAERERLEREVAERVRAEQALRESERRLLRMADTMPQIVWTADPDGSVDYFNGRWYELTGMSPKASLTLDGWRAALHPDDLERLYSVRNSAVVGGTLFETEARLRDRAGNYRWYLIRSRPVHDESGRVVRRFGTATDIDDRMRAEEVLRASEERFRQLAEAMPQIVWMTRTDYTTVYYNGRWFDYTGLSPEESYEPDGWKAAAHPDDVDRLIEVGARADAEDAPFEAEYRLRHRSGVYRWHLGRSVPMRDESGRVTRRFGTATDIHDRRRGEQAARFLAEASASLAAPSDEASTLERVAQLAVPAFADWCVVDMAGEDGVARRLAVAHVDPSKVEYAHEIYRRYPPDPNSTRGIYEVLRTGEPIIVSEITDEMIAAGTRDEDEYRILRELGIKSFLCVPLAGRGGTLGAISFVSAESGHLYDAEDLRVAQDLASRAGIAIENARLYDRLRAADRRKDEFLATLAHELRNPLAPIRNALLLMKAYEGNGQHNELERSMAERQVIHLTRLVDDLMDVSRISSGKTELRKQPLALATILERAVESIRLSLEERGHDLAVLLPDPAIRLEADPTRLEQVFWNLLNNAIKYTEPGGSIRISASREGGEVIVRVGDSGVGIEPEILPRIFDMFVQASDHGGRSQGGLGIGLSLVRTLVEMHGGSVSARSDGPGLGSEFNVRLPALSDAPAGLVATPSPPTPARVETKPARRRILVVDDNVDAAKSLARVLNRLYDQEVRVAHDGPAAIENSLEFLPEVVLLDIGMPGMDGYEVARRLRGRPETEGAVLVALTGWGQEADRRKSKEAGIDHHLIKPADPEDLLRLIQGQPLNVP
jgi:PAS domain S-box-containing protein